MICTCCCCASMTHLTRQTCRLSQNHRPLRVWGPVCCNTLTDKLRGTQLKFQLHNNCKGRLNNRNQNKPVLWTWTHLGLLWSEGTELALRKPSLKMERRHDSFSDLDRTGGPQSSLEPPRSPAPEALRVISERDVSGGADGSGWASGAKLSSMICLALSQI